MLRRIRIILRKTLRTSLRFIEKTKYMESSKYARVFAKLFDLLVVLFLSLLLYPIGLILGILYFSVSDAMQDGRSLGKTIMGLKVVSEGSDKKCDLKQSCIRNLPITIPLFFAIIPLWGWVLAIILGPPLCLIEIYLMFSLDTEKRIGDAMADTLVISDAVKFEKQQKKTGWFEEDQEDT